MPILPQLRHRLGLYDLKTGLRRRDRFIKFSAIEVRIDRAKACQE